MTWSQRVLVAFFTVAGALHFLRPAMYEQIVPDYLWAEHELVLASGAAGCPALGVIPQRTRRIRGPLARRHARRVLPRPMCTWRCTQTAIRASSPALLWGRLPLQALAIWWVLTATRPSRGAAAARSPFSLT